MSKNNKRKERGKVRRYIYTDVEFRLLVITVRNGRIIKATHYQGKHRITLHKPLLVLKDKSTTDLFIESQFNKGGSLKLMERDLFSYWLRPKYIPTCQMCGVYPVYEHVGYTQHGKIFSQGYNKECHLCEGLEEEPMPWVSQVESLGEALKAVLNEAIAEAIQEEEVLGGPDMEDYEHPSRQAIIEAMIANAVEELEFFEQLEIEMDEFMEGGE